MPLTPLNQVIRLKSRPETTFSLEKAIKDGAKTVESYRFTPSIRDYACEILELAASGRGQGYWIQAEYGAGKTHLLGTLGVLLTDTTNTAWEAVSDPEVRSLKGGLVGKSRLFPVVLNCKGRLATDGGEMSLQRVLERSIEDALEAHQLKGKISISTSDEIREWWSHASAGVRSDITKKVQSRFTGSPTPEDLLEKKGAETFAQAVIQAARELRLDIPFTKDVRTRFNHIYSQLTREHGFHGLLLIIDEFKSWQDLHPAGSPGFAEDEHVLETLAFHLPVDERLRIITVVASQSAPPGKLAGGAQGDRFRTFPLFASEQSSHEYDEIVAFRVREIKQDHMPDVDQYYVHYFKKFKFLAQTKKDYFRDIFPFQPRCFEVIRNISKRELATARSSIHYVYEVLEDGETINRQGLIKVADLLRSDNLIKDLQTAAYKEAYVSYQSAHQALQSLFDEEHDRQLAEEVLKTLFLWYCAAPESPRGLTAQELAEACLATDEILNGEDLIHGIVLQRLKELSQVEYTNKERGAFFRVSAISGPTYSQILAQHQRKVDDDSEAGPEWQKLLTTPTHLSEGVEMLFAGQTLDKLDKTTGHANKVRYDGERVITARWSKSWGGPVVDKTNYSQHFRLVYLLEPADVPVDDLSDDRLAVIVPGSWKEVARDEMRRYAAILRVEKDYALQQGPDAEEIRQTNKTKKREVLTEILRKQAEAYRKGKIVTKAGLGLDPNQIFAAPAKSDENISSVLLEHAYRQSPFENDKFKRELTGVEPGRIFGVLFQGSAASADKAALENFGVGLGLVTKDKPFDFDPTHCAFFETIRSELRQSEGDLKLYSFYEKYTGAPYGIPVDLLSLYLLAFVRHSRPQCYVSVKPEAGLVLSNGRQPRDNRLGYNEVPLVQWSKGRLQRSFDRLVEESGPSWNDYIEYFREIDDTLQAADAPEQVLVQKDRLKKAQEDLAARLKGISSRLSSLAGLLNQDITGELSVVERLNSVAIADPHHLQTFGATLEEEFDRDLLKYKEAFDGFRKLEQLDQLYLQPVSEAVRYMDEIEWLPEGELKNEQGRIRSQVKLKDFCSTPERAGEVLAAFEIFRDEYVATYQRHYRDYRDGMLKLHKELEAVEGLLHGLQNINSIEYLGKVLDAKLQSRHKELLARTDTSHLQEGIPNVEKRPVANAVRLNMFPPAEAIKQFKSELDEALIRCIELLSPPPILGVLAEDDDPGTNEVVKAVKEVNESRVASLFTKEVAARVKELLNKARMIVVEVQLSDFGPLHLGNDGDDVVKAVQKFEQFIRQRVEKARKDNPGKIVQLNLK